MELMHNNQMYLIVESSDPNIVLSILPDESDIPEHKSIMDLSTHSGNIMFVMDDKYYNQHLKFF